MCVALHVLIPCIACFIFLSNCFTCAPLYEEDTSTLNKFHTERQKSEKMNDDRTEISTKNIETKLEN